MNKVAKGKRVLVHVGPHKTGSTSIQTWLREHKSLLGEWGITVLHDAETHQAARLLCSEKYGEAEAALRKIADHIGLLDTDSVILSQEDFSGDLPGRSRKRGVYPRLAKNLRIISRTLARHSVEFVFFEREPSDWLASCYHQHLVHRTRFHDLSAFRDFVGGPPNWADTLNHAELATKARLHRVEYSKVPENGITALLSLLDVPSIDLKVRPATLNKSPTNQCIRAFEHINANSAFPRTAWFSKKLILDQDASNSGPIQPGECNYDIHQAAIYAFPSLLKRALGRFPVQDVEDLLPPVDCDLFSLWNQRLPDDVACPDVSRASMNDQSSILDYHFRGKSSLAKLNALAISYLRRNTLHTDKARSLFLRIWKECGAFILNELSSRWLISTLQTFFDHGENESQRIVGGCGYFYANLIKIYEGERAIEGLDQDGVLAGTQPRTPNKFRGLDRYAIGGTDLLLNANALILDISLMDNASGMVLQEFLLRVKNSGNVFTRFDATRAFHNVEVEGFEDTWSFFVKPDARGGGHD